MIKNLAKRLAIFFLLMFAITTTASADTTTGACGPNVTYSYDESTNVLTISGTGRIVDYSLWTSETPFQIFDMEKVVIEEGVTYIGDNAFYGISAGGCSELTSIELPSTLTELGDRCFHSTGITSITIPNSVTTIGEYAFTDSNITSLYIPSSVTSIGDGFASSCDNLTSISIDASNSSYSVVDGVLFNKALTTLICYPAGKTQSTYTIADSVTTIATSAFAGNAYLDTVTIPSSITTLNNAAFSSCTNLQNITIPSSVTSIGGSAFNSCTSLVTIAIPNSVSTLALSTFENCESLQNVSIANSVTQIGQMAFKNCSSLQSIVIPDSVVSVGNELFSGCLNLSNVTLSNSLTELPSLMFNFCMSLQYITLPDSLTYIGDYAFMGCSKLMEIELPPLVADVGSGIFSNCTSLKSVTLSAAMTEVSGTLISGCISLTDVILPESITSIGLGAFVGCNNLQTLYIPTSVTHVGLNVFGLNYKFESDFSLPTEIYYAGTEAQWNAITVAADNDPFLGLPVHYNSSAPESTATTTTFTAVPNTSTILVDGQQVAFDAYGLMNNNYFKLRDVAYCLNGTVASFEVSWNSALSAIEITSGASYTAVGGEMTAGDGTSKSAISSLFKVYLDGEEISLTAYVINDNTYFKLRDIAQALGFNVSWDSEAVSIIIATDEEYTFT